MDAAAPGVSSASFVERPSTASDNSAASDDVVSRLSMSEEQREIRRRFEEKQRDEARRSAHDERIAKKKANLWNSGARLTDIVIRFTPNLGQLPQKRRAIAFLHFGVKSLNSLDRSP